MINSQAQNQHLPNPQQVAPGTTENSDENTYGYGNTFAPMKTVDTAIHSPHAGTLKLQTTTHRMPDNSPSMQ